MCWAWDFDQAVQVPVLGGLKPVLPLTKVVQKQVLFTIWSTQGTESSTGVTEISTPVTETSTRKTTWTRPLSTRVPSSRAKTCKKSKKWNKKARNAQFVLKSFKNISTAREISSQDSLLVGNDLYCTDLIKSHWTKHNGLKKETEKVHSCDKRVNKCPKAQCTIVRSDLSSRFAICVMKFSRTVRINYECPTVLESWKLLCKSWFDYVDSNSRFVYEKGTK